MQVQASAQLETELHQPPTDGISSLAFANTSDMLLVASWDKAVRMYDARKNQLRFKYEHKAAVLDCTFSHDDSLGFSGGLDRNVVMVDFKSGQQTILGTHEKPVKCVEFHADTGLCISGSWDETVQTWDPRASKALAGTINAGGKVYAMDISSQRLVVGTSANQVLVYDMRNLMAPEQTRQSPLDHQIRAIRCFPNNEGFALSSVEGKVAIEYFDLSAKTQKRKYAFKCHRKVLPDQTQMLYPVNAIAYHPTFGTFATGGCDNVVNMWDGENKKRICQYPAYPSSVAALDFNHDGSLLAVASSYTFESGDREHPPDQVFIRYVNENEVSPRAKGV